jgi:hypothetical protein
MDTEDVPLLEREAQLASLGEYAGEARDGLFTPQPQGPLFGIAAKLGGEPLELCRADAPREDLDLIADGWTNAEIAGLAER